MRAMIWEIDPVLLSLGPINVRWYGLFFLLGFVIAFQGMVFFARKENKPVKAIDDLLVYIFWGTFIGARLVHCFFYEPVYYLQQPLEIFFVWKGGLASHGALLGIVTAIFLFAKKHQEFSFLWVLDRVAIVAAAAGAMIRIGNFFNSEIIGKPSDIFFSVVFKAVDAIPRYPAQLMESCWYWFSFGVLLWIYSKIKNKVAEGFFFGASMIFIFMGRFVLEFFKENQSAFEAGWILNMGQLLSLPVVALGLFMVIKFKYAKTNI
jgi:prolipoprotein diacylglyceryl transferase